MATESEIKEVMFDALVNADQTHGEPKGRRLQISIGESGIVIGALYDALVAKGLLVPEKKPKKSKK